MSRIEAVIFDWAGTTVDYGCFAPVNAFKEAFLSFGIEAAIEEVRKPMGMLKRDHIKTMLEMPRIRSLWIETYKREPGGREVDEIYRQFEPALLRILDRYSDPKPGVLETVEELRRRGIKIGSTTGYTDRMMEIVTANAEKKGYRPDCWYSPDSVNGMGRPYPYMIFKNMEMLKISSVGAVLKVGDTLSDIREGVNAGVKTVGILEGSSLLGMSEEEYASCPEERRARLLKETEQKYRSAGADWVVRDIGGILDLIE